NTEVNIHWSFFRSDTFKFWIGISSAFNGSCIRKTNSLSDQVDTSDQLVDQSLSSALSRSDCSFHIEPREERTILISLKKSRSERSASIHKTTSLEQDVRVGSRDRTRHSLNLTIGQGEFCSKFLSLIFSSRNTSLKSLDGSLEFSDTLKIQSICRKSLQSCDRCSSIRYLLLSSRYLLRQLIKSNFSLFLKSHETVTFQFKKSQLRTELFLGIRDDRVMRKIRGRTSRCDRLVQSLLDIGQFSYSSIRRAGILRQPVKSLS